MTQALVFGDFLVPVLILLSRLQLRRVLCRDALLPEAALDIGSTSDDRVDAAPSPAIPPALRFLAVPGRCEVPAASEDFPHPANLTQGPSRPPPHLHSASILGLGFCLLASKPGPCTRNPHWREPVASSYTTSLPSILGAQATAAGELPNPSVQSPYFRAC